MRGSEYCKQSFIPSVKPGVIRHLASGSKREMTLVAASLSSAENLSLENQLNLAVLGFFKLKKTENRPFVFALYKSLAVKPEDLKHSFFN